MKNLRKVTYVFIAVFVVGILATGAASAKAGNSANARMQNNGAVCLYADTLDTTVRAGDLSEAEKASLEYMREEEKLARDVYLYLYEEWKTPIFNNIAKSEQKHMDAVESLLNKYGVEDPAATTMQGEFINPDLQELYDQLILEGSKSREDALKVGVLIEETDIDDLNMSIEVTTHNDIKTVYSNLLKGSYNHLSAFNRVLDK